MKANIDCVVICQTLSLNVLTNEIYICSGLKEKEIEILKLILDVHYWFIKQIL